ncbi:hypothetical protein L226DRAFT_575520 [Lentinus tigrinus ALCF2SS1-7]|uniref:uncharacterized protein n=1 Tax=Lentinus tigrinus ALCF2SS1-7 TaxID=1328758 RepID=UPI001165F75D|nr:hypothetical protein L226DRAFT_575520 [Lentinus tigrinus ALCF2SS1-7]
MDRSIPPPTVEPYQSRPADIESQRPATPTDEAPERRTVDLRMFGLFVMGTTVVVLESLVLWWAMGRNSHKPKASWL